MDEASYLASEENIPLALRSWLWKKKRNSVFPEAESQSKAEVWVQTVIPSGSQVAEDSLRSDVEPKSQATITSSVPLPGSVTTYLDEMQVHPSCAIKSIMIDEETGQVEIGQEESWLNKFRINRNKLAFLKCLIGWKGNKTAVEKVDTPNAPGICSHDNHRLHELDGCMAKEEQPYIPYKLAKLYITKVVKDMQQMKIRHMKVIKELDCIRKDSQEQAIIVLKNHHSEKMKILKAQLEAYQELVDKKNKQWQNTAKNLREKNRQLSQENKDLLYQIKQQNEKWAEEKTWILESFSQKLDHLYAQHSLTLQELQRIRLNMEKVQEIVNLWMDFLQQKALFTAEKVIDEMEEHEHLLQKELLWKAQDMLEMAKQSLYKREREVAELLQSESGHNETMKPQITVTTLLKTLVSKVHTIYCDLPEAQQCINQLIEKNDAERADRKEEFNNAQADILSYKVIYGNKPTDYKREQFSAKLSRNLVNAKSELEYAETEKIALDCIQKGEIPDWISKYCPYLTLTDSDQKMYADEKSHFPDEVMQTLNRKSQDADETEEQKGMHQLWAEAPITDEEVLCEKGGAEKHIMKEPWSEN
ncbi:uncharacterized protein LOC115653557 [Gopherus evgoodei]|uniref:uncharacterized protein LOC115653557 n=1 Tax=Gopherus evgoodei TaxID=1825980 RepID=UPI0011CEDBA6|nr:uncharacterized protein LOC115653557 [Gopherus evgoodei]